MVGELLIMMVVGTSSGVAVHSYGVAAEVAASALSSLVAWRLLRGGRRG